MIEVRENSNPSVDDEEVRYELIIDNEVIHSSESVDFNLTKENEFRVDLRDERLIQKIFAQRFLDLPEQLSITCSPILPELIDKAFYINFTTKFDKEVGEYQLSFSINCRYVNWKYPWTIPDFNQEFTDISKQRSTTRFTTRFHDIGLRFWGDAENQIGNLEVYFEVNTPDMPIGDAVSEFEVEILDLIETTQASLTSKLNEESVVVHFNFPEEVRIPCEQYLLYFIQFLKDLGVEATARLQHEAGQVLFAVTPTNKNEALDNIRAALDTYLRLAASPVNSASVLSAEIEVQRLSANIQHLQGQLTLAHAVLQAKDATIQQQQLTIEHQRRLLSGEIMLESLRDVPPKSAATEVPRSGGQVRKQDSAISNLDLPEAMIAVRQLFYKG